MNPRPFAAGAPASTSARETPTTRLAASVVVLLVVLAAGDPLVAQSPHPFDAETLRRTVVDSAGPLEAPGVAVAVIGRDGEITVVCGGRRDESEPVTEDTVFEIGSVSKVATAALAVLVARESGRVDALSLEATLASWFPDLPGAETIRLRHLLQHTSGLQDPLLDEGLITRFYMSPQSAPTAEELVRSVDALDFAPGSGWKYSNVGFLAVALVLEHVTDERFDELLESRLLAPLGLDQVDSVRVSEAEVPRAHGYRDLAGTGQLVDMSALAGAEPFLRATVGAGSLLASAGDLARLLRGVVAGDLFTEDERSHMHHWIDRPDGHRYGLGLLRIEDAQGRVLIGHRGNSSGFSAEAWHLPEHDVTVAVLTNRGGLQVSSITEAVLDLVLN